MVKPFTHFFIKVFSLVIVFTSLTVLTAHAQSFDFAKSAGTFAPVTSATSIPITSDEATSTALPIGFNFNYYGQPYTDFYASSNGFITFSGSTGSMYNNSFQYDDNLVVAPLWDD